jgi:hypothetical protein
MTEPLLLARRARSHMQLGGGNEIDRALIWQHRRRRPVVTAGERERDPARERHARIGDRLRSRGHGVKRQGGHRDRVGQVAHRDGADRRIVTVEADHGDDDERLLRRIEETDVAAARAGQLAEA